MRSRDCKRRSPAVCWTKRAEIERAGFVLDYLEARHAETLSRISSLQDGPVRLLVRHVSVCDQVIDNLAV